MPRKLPLPPCRTCNYQPDCIDGDRDGYEVSSKPTFTIPLICCIQCAELSVLEDGQLRPLTVAEVMQLQQQDPEGYQKLQAMRRETRNFWNQHHG